MRAFQRRSKGMQGLFGSSRRYSCKIAVIARQHQIAHTLREGSRPGAASGVKVLRRRLEDTTNIGMMAEQSELEWRVTFAIGNVGVRPRLYQQCAGVGMPGFCSVVKGGTLAMVDGCYSLTQSEKLTDERCVSDGGGRS